MTDQPEPGSAEAAHDPVPGTVRLSPRPGFPEHKIVDEFVCPEGHVVQPPYERSAFTINHIHAERSLVPCAECGTFYAVSMRPVATEASDRLVELARDEGYLPEPEDG